MRSKFAFAASLILVVVPAAFEVGCSAAQQRQERQVLDFAQSLCVLEHSMGAPPAIATACMIEEAAVPLIERFLSAHQKAALRQYGAGSASASSSAAPPPAPPATASSAPPPAASSAPAVTSAAPSASAAKKKK